MYLLVSTNAQIRRLNVELQTQKGKIYRKRNLRKSRKVMYLLRYPQERCHSLGQAGCLEYIK